MILNNKNDIELVQVIKDILTVFNVDQKDFKGCIEVLKKHDVKGHLVELFKNKIYVYA